MNEVFINFRCIDRGDNFTIVSPVYDFEEVSTYFYKISLKEFNKKSTQLNIYILYFYEYLGYNLPMTDNVIDDDDSTS